MKKTKTPQVRQLLEMDILPAWRKVDASIVEALLTAYAAWPAAAGIVAYGPSGPLIASVIAFLGYTIDHELSRIVTMRQQNAELNTLYIRASTEQDKRQLILDYARTLGASRRQLQGDRRAFARWFGHDAITDRYRRQHAATERKLVVCLQRLGHLCAFVLRHDGAQADYRKLWHRLNLEITLKPVLRYDGDSRVALAGFRCLTTALQAMPAEMQEGSMDDETLQYTYHAALEPHQQSWIQCEALHLLQSLSLTSLHTALKQRLTHPHAGDDLFVRRRAVLLLGANLARLPALEEMFAVVVLDPSPFVRQAIPPALYTASAAAVSTWLAHLLRVDTVPQVRAAALLEIPRLLQRQELCGELLALLQETLATEQDDLVVRVACKVSFDGLSWLLQHGQQANAGQWYEALLPQIESLHQQASSLAVRRWAAQTRERLWCAIDPVAQTVQQRLQPWLHDLQPGHHKRLPRRLLAGCSEETMARVLAVLSQEDFGYDLVRGWWSYRVTRGHVFGFRLWRLLHEWRHPAPDKRQAFRHTVGRIFRGPLQIPSGIMAELATTKVPGEPLHIATEAGWRPYLPLPDAVLSSLDHGFRACPTQVFTSEGITEIIPPRSLWRRCLARLRLTWGFARYAQRRNWQEHHQHAPQDYLEALQQLGFTITLRPYTTSHAREGTSLDTAVKRFFPALLLPGEVWSRLQNYFFSVYENSLLELSVFAALALTFFLGRHLYLNWQVHAVRHGLALVLGGWGTRGKSGTERLKAAMLNALGYSLVSKTTGCEAMFLYAPSYGSLREMFLFRPYDKATIWEQHNVACLAGKLRADVMLWECMALNPAFVKLLQRHWMRDDIATITNTYPDHEDIQGPAGINIPEVMTNFIPAGSTLLTSEEQMRPILRDAAQRFGTSMRSVGWLEAGLLTPDVLERFPYEEHPYNIALVLALATELGIEHDFALKEIADRVVPDLGVLKAYPVAPVRSRRLEFVNGMSANERFGCLGNWSRMGFDTQAPEQEPGVWISTVVNNRADRVPRSRVFANVLVADVRADRHFLIGSNLQGLQGYIQEAWETYAQELTLWPASGEAPQDMFQQMARHLRIPTSQAQVMAGLRAMLMGHQEPVEVEALLACWEEPQQLLEALKHAGLEAEAILAHLQNEQAVYDEYQAFADQLGSVTAPQRAHYDAMFRALLWQWFQRKIVVMEDFHATGNQVVERICTETPPGFHNRIMGMQNIKGTGLDFVYAWQAWDRCCTACTQLRSGEPQSAAQGLHTLLAFREYNLLCAEYMRDTLAQAQRAAFAQRESVQAQLTVIAANLDDALENISEQEQTVQHASWLQKIVGVVEAFCDAGDAVRRRKMAERIYRDLIAERISDTRAVVELQALNKRQKGGWLVAQMQNLGRFATRSHVFGKGTAVS